MNTRLIQMLRAGIVPGTSHRMPAPTECPFCRHRLEGSQAADGRTDPPAPGHFSICVQCAALTVYAGDLSLRPPTADERREFNEQVAADPGLRQTIATIRKLRGDA